MIDEIPVLTLKEHDEARRFITLIDELYEAKCVLLCSAVTSSPDELFVGRRQHTEEEENVDSSFVLLDQQDGFQAEGINVEAGETLGMDVAQSNGMTVGELASVQELSFAFRRAASRIREMTSKSWWEKNI
jgi:Predicted ATPase